MIHCFYHYVDLDGHCSAAIVKRKYPNVHLIPANHGFDLDISKIKKGDKVFCVDFRLSMSLMIDLQRILGYENFIWIDHHISAIKEAINLNYKAEGIQKNGVAACELVWKYLYPQEPMPKVVKLLGAFDIWDLDYNEDVIPFQYGMQSYQTDPQFDEFDWEELLNAKHFRIYDKILEEGKAVHRYKKQYDADYARAYSCETTLCGLPAIAMNYGICSSLSFDSVYDPSKHDIMIRYVRLKSHKWSCSLFTTKDHVDVSEIAKQFGGGGHAKAAGFQTSQLPFEI